MVVSKIYEDSNTRKFKPMKYHSKKVVEVKDISSEEEEEAKEDIKKADVILPNEELI